PPSLPNRQNRRRTQLRLHGERELRVQEEHPHAVVGGGGARLEHESGLREVELFGDRLHGLGVEPAWLPKHSEGVATEGSVREYVDEPVLVASHRVDLAETRRRGPPRDGAPAEGRGVPVALRGF